MSSPAVRGEAWLAFCLAFCPLFHDVSHVLVYVSVNVTVESASPLTVHPWTLPFLPPSWPWPAPPTSSVTPYSIPAAMQLLQFAAKAICITKCEISSLRRRALAALTACLCRAPPKRKTSQNGQGEGQGEGELHSKPGALGTWQCFQVPASLLWRQALQACTRGQTRNRAGKECFSKSTSAGKLALRNATRFTFPGKQVGPSRSCFRLRGV